MLRRSKEEGLELVRASEGAIDELEAENHRLRKMMKGTLEKHEDKAADMKQMNDHVNKVIRHNKMLMNKLVELEETNTKRSKKCEALQKEEEK